MNAKNNQKSDSQAQNITVFFPYTAIFIEKLLIKSNSWLNEKCIHLRKNSNNNKLYRKKNLEFVEPECYLVWI